MRTPRRPDRAVRLSALAGLVILWVSCAGLIGQGLDIVPARAAHALEEKGAPPAAKAAPQEDARAAPAPEEPRTCEERYARLKKFHADLPADFRKSKRSPDEMKRASMEAIGSAERFLATCATAPEIDAVKTAEVQYILAKTYHIMKAVRRQEFQQDLEPTTRSEEIYARVEALMARYLANIETLAATAHPKLPDEHSFKARALMLVGQAAMEGGRLEKAKEVFVAYLAKYGKAESERADSDEVVGGLARVYLDLQECDAGIKLIEQALKERYSSRSYPHYLEHLWKLHLCMGGFDGLEQFVRTVKTVFPLRLKGKELDDDQRQIYETLLVYSGFRDGYVRFARGDFPGAAEAFREHIQSINDRGKNGQLPQAWTIYRDRSSDNLAFLEELAGRPAPLELDLGPGWVTSKKVNLAQSRGKLVLLLFRRIGDDRSAQFLRPLAQFAAAEPDLEMAVISFLRPGQNPEEIAETMRADLQAIGYTGAAGLDPNPETLDFFKTYQAMVGTATFIIVNRQGELVWFQQDPRGQDVYFVRAIVKRVAGK
jgi:tetratricopeptide (TPR) repeat protein